MTESSKIGRALSDESSLVRAYNGWTAYDEVRSKNWPADEGEAIRTAGSPFLLVIDTEFSDFDPQRHAFAILWLHDYGREGATKREEELGAVLAKLAAAARDPRGDVFGFIRSIAQSRADSQAMGRARVWESFSGAAVDSSDLTAGGEGDDDSSRIP